MLQQYHCVELTTQEYQVQVKTKSATNTQLNGVHEIISSSRLQDISPFLPVPQQCDAAGAITEHSCTKPSGSSRIEGICKLKSMVFHGP